GDLDSSGSDPRVPVVLKRGERVALSRTVRLFSPDDIAGVGNELVRGWNLGQADGGQALAGCVQPGGGPVLAGRGGEGGGGGSEEPAETPPARYVAVFPGRDGAGPLEAGMRDVVEGRVLSNFVLVLDEDIEVQDDIEAQRVFAGRLTIDGRQV